ncbi:hypothetical protein JXB31_01555 [Candidatus Woesearchaeota archaeon]|nr:hypothetical protein [Candidatus Woesearchaeota archaeon]
MKDKENTKKNIKPHKLLFIILVILLLAFMLFLAIRYQGITAKIIAQGGNVTQVNLELPSNINYWSGIYGNISYSYLGSTVSVDGSNAGVFLHNINLTRCYFTELYATTLQSIDWTDVVPAEPSDVDSYLGLPNTNIMSGSRIFTKQKAFNVFGSNLLSYYTDTTATGGGYDLGVLKQDNTLIFVTHIKNSSYSFNNVKSDYQLMLPAPGGSTVSYNFFLDPFDETICGMNNACPEIVVKTNGSAKQGMPMLIVLEGFDPDLDLLSFSTNCSLLIEPITSTISIINWTPGNAYVGYNSIMFSVTDQWGHRSDKTVEIFVEPVNDPPVLALAGNIEAYYHVPMTRAIYATDIDNLNSYAPDDNTLEFFTTQHYSWLNLETFYNASGDAYYGIINFTPLEPHKGMWDVVLGVTDGTTADYENLTLTVGYCGNLDYAGEPRCETDYENCNNCPSDCGECYTDTDSYMTIRIPYKNCLGKELKAEVFKLVERGECETENEIIGSREICGNLEGVALDIFILDKSREWQAVLSTETDENGSFSYTLKEEGQYKIVADKNKFHTAIRYFNAAECISLDAKEEEPDLAEKAAESKDSDSGKIQEFDMPGQAVSKVSRIKSIIVAYTVITILSLVMINFIYKYYVANRDSSAMILAIRRRYSRASLNYAIHIKPVLKKAWYHIKDILGF